MTSSSRRLATAFALAFAMVSSEAFAGNPSAQDFATARVLYKEGKDLRAAGDLKGALDKLTAAHSLGHTPLTGIELARVQVQLGLLVEARETALGVGRLAVEPDETPRSAEARKDASKLAEELRPRIASLRVHVTVPTAIVTIDGVQLQAVALGEARKVNPGHHVVTAHVEGGATVSSTTDVAEGQSSDVSLDPPPAPVVVIEKPKETVIVTPPPPVTEKNSGLGGLVIAGISVTSAGLVIGAVGGLAAIFTKSDLTASCGTSGQCPQGVFGELDAARAEAVLSTVGFCVAGGGLVLLIVGLVTHTSPKESMRGLRILPDLGIDHVGVTGAF
jgi:hypothetical protein